MTTAQEGDPWVEEMLNIVGNVSDGEDDILRHSMRTTGGEAVVPSIERQPISVEEKVPPLTRRTLEHANSSLAISVHDELGSDEEDTRSVTFGRDNLTPSGDIQAPRYPKKRGPRPGSRNKGTVFRQPQNVSSDVYYGLSVTPAAWALAPRDRQKSLVHVARIEETPDGEVQRPRCARCEQKSFAVCRRYTSIVGEFANVKRCARCIYDGKPCT